VSKHAVLLRFLVF